MSDGGATAAAAAAAAAAGGGGGSGSKVSCQTSYGVSRFTRQCSDWTSEWTLVHHMHITYMSHTCHMHVTCTSHAY